jgi:hypothetical protein
MISSFKLNDISTSDVYPWISLEATDYTSTIQFDVGQNEALGFAMNLVDIADTALGLANVAFMDKAIALISELMDELHNLEREDNE